MLTVFLAAVLWGGTWAFGVPVTRRLALLAGLWIGGIAAHLLLPPDHAVRQALGGDARVWLVLGGVIALIAVYFRGVGWLRARARPVAEAAAEPVPAVSQTASAYQPDELDRYARHIFLHEIGGPGQKALKGARVLVLGAGGLGAPALLYLAAAGVGRITVVDHDRVERSNLQRQIIHADARIGEPKALSAAAALRALNPHVEVLPIIARFGTDTGPDLIAGHDLVLDGTDDLATRELVNRLAVAAGVPLVWGALARWEGQVSLFDPVRGGPCLACLFPVRPAPGMVPSCAEAGVAGPLPGIIGAIMATEAVKQITGAGQTLRGRLMLHDALYADARVIGVKPRPGCPVCGHLHQS